MKFGIQIVQIPGKDFMKAFILEKCVVPGDRNKKICVVGAMYNQVVFSKAEHKKNYMSILRFLSAYYLQPLLA